MKRRRTAGDFPGAQRILVLPLFPQYCGVSTGAVHDQVTDELSRWRWMPELRFISEYHEHPGYIEALRASVADHWALNGRTEHLLMSFHGIPRIRRPALASSPASAD